ncbi:hypothetical protein Aau02nite_28740 [Amorphoplanes auranticolor]|uniref:Peptidase C39-like protein n=1 Tax=Actinoplanes auranticolor TaxID=47988 RepID=A0A919SA43_9ACTN|nr:hypothetical protein Aau02nite_28740 [Actinoplanes auranticolor]
MLNGADRWFGENVYGLEDIESRGGLHRSVALREQFWRRIENGVSNWTPPIVSVVAPADSPYEPDDWTNTSRDPVDHWFVISGYEPTRRIVSIIDPASGWPRFDPDHPLRLPVPARDEGVPVLLGRGGRTGPR